jgi:hypothetical protein
MEVFNNQCEIESFLLIALVKEYVALDNLVIFLTLDLFPFVVLEI